MSGQPSEYAAPGAYADMPPAEVTRLPFGFTLQFTSPRDADIGEAIVRRLMAGQKKGDVGNDRHG